jgi:muramoyltetrapeptide carboxypeptidase LdcA involved in peptidoglycan recycling
VREPAVARLTGLGLRVTFAEHARQVTFYGPHFSTFGMRDTTSG